MMPVYVISLSDAHARRETMRVRLNALRIPFAFFDAFDGRKPLGENPILDRRSMLTDIQFACALSHMELAKRVTEGDPDMALILEDDADPAPRLPEVISRADAFTFDILKLEGIARANRPFLERGHIGGRALRVYSHVSMGTAGYILRRKAARQLLQEIRVVDAPIDEMISGSRLDMGIIYFTPLTMARESSTLQG